MSIPMAGHRRNAQKRPDVRVITDTEAMVRVADEAVPWAMEYTLLKEMVELLKQFDEFTSATSSGRANVISTHWEKKEC
jgi:hypothetical protein